MSNVNSSQTPKKVFISCRAGTDTSVLFDVLVNLGLDPVNWEQSLSQGHTIWEQVQNYIAAADLVIVVLDEEGSQSVIFEAGCALGAGKPVLIISDGNIPSDMSGIISITAPVSDRKALSFQLQSVLSNWKFSTSRMTHSNGNVERQRTKKLIHPAELGSKIEQRIAGAFSLSTEIEDVVSQPNQDSAHGYIPDLGIVLFDPKRYFPGPLLVEIKLSLKPIGLTKIVKLLESYVIKAQASAGLLVVDDGDKSELKAISPHPLIFVVGVDELERLLRAKSFVQSLRMERNRFVHSAR